MLFGDFAESHPKDITDLIDEEESTGEYGYYSDSDLEDDGDEASSLNIQSDFHTSQLSSSAIAGDSGLAFEVREEHNEKGKVVRIPDVAFVT